MAAIYIWHIRLFFILYYDIKGKRKKNIDKI